MTKIFTLFFVWCCICVHATAQDTYSNNIDIESYQIALDLSHFEDKIIGSVAISFRLNKASTNISFDFVASTKDGRGLKVTDIESTEPINWTHSDENLQIDKNSPFEKNQLYTLTIHYFGKPLDGLIISKNLQNKATVFADNWPNRAHYWFPCIDQPSDKAFVNFKVKYPDKYQLIANGERVKDSSISKHIHYTEYQSTTVLPTKVMVIGMAEFSVSAPCMSGNTEVTSWIFKNQEKEGFADYAPACDILSWFTNRIAPYPFEKLANVQSKTRYGGMENASCIFYYEGSVSGRGENESLIAHEIAHQWFGNSATEKSWSHLWLSEGFATYFTDLYVLDQYGEKAFQERMAQERQKAISFYQKYKAPVVDTNQQNINLLLNPNAYQKGAWVLHLLRHEIGDSLFWESIRAYYYSYQFANATTNDFNKIVNTITGKDLGPFFHQWLKTQGYPQLSITWREFAVNKVEISIVQEQQTLFEFAIEFQIHCAGETKLYSQQISEKKTTILLDANAPILDVQVDPFVKLFFAYSLRRL